MIVTIHQPDFIPWLGFFDRMAKSNLYIVLDDVQFLRRGWHHRDKIKTSQGVMWLTVPVIKKGKYFQDIKDVEIDNSQTWRRKNLETIRAAYSKSVNFSSCFSELNRIYDKNHKYLIELNIDMIEYMSSAMGVTTPIRYSSELSVEGTSTLKLVNLVKKVNGNVYLSGLGARTYLDETLFTAHNISVKWQEYEHPTYQHLHGEFIPMLSAIDYMFNCKDGLDKTFITDDERKSFPETLRTNQ